MTKSLVTEKDKTDSQAYIVFLQRLKNPLYYLIILNNRNKIKSKKLS